MFNLKIIYTMRLTKGFNFHPTSLEFVADERQERESNNTLATINNKRYGND